VGHVHGLLGPLDRLDDPLHDAPAGLQVTGEGLDQGLVADGQAHVEEVAPGQRHLHRPRRQLVGPGQVAPQHGRHDLVVDGGGGEAPVAPAHAALEALLEDGDGLLVPVPVGEQHRLHHQDAVDPERVAGGGRRLGALGQQVVGAVEVHPRQGHAQQQQGPPPAAVVADGGGQGQGLLGVLDEDVELPAGHRDRRDPGVQQRLQRRALVGSPLDGPLQRRDALVGVAPQVPQPDEDRGQPPPPGRVG
jgi:hypothetical protein